MSSKQFTIIKTWNGQVLDGKSEVTRVIMTVSRMSHLAYVSLFSLSSF